MHMLPKFRPFLSRQVLPQCLGPTGMVVGLKGVRKVTDHSQR